MVAGHQHIFEPRQAGSFICCQDFIQDWPFFALPTLYFGSNAGLFHHFGFTSFMRAQFKQHIAHCLRVRRAQIGAVADHALGQGKKSGDLCQIHEKIGLFCEKWDFWIIASSMNWRCKTLDEKPRSVPYCSPLLLKPCRNQLIFLKEAINQKCTFKAVTIIGEMCCV